MKIGLIALMLVIAWLPVPSAAQQTPDQTIKGSAPHTEHITGKGCVQPGKLKNCVMVNDIKAHRKYDVFFKADNKPEMYTAVEFEGIGYHQHSHCNDGQPVQVVNWKPAEGECTKPATPPAKKTAPAPKSN